MATTLNTPLPHGPTQSPFRRRRPSILTLPPELLLTIASLLPLPSLNALISSSRSFRELHGLTIRKPSFCPWRRRYEFHRNAYQIAYNAAELRVYARSMPSSTSEPEHRLTGPHATQLEYEAIVEGFMRDFGFTDPEAEVVGHGAEEDPIQGEQQKRRRRFLLLDEKMLLEALLSLWRNEESKNVVLQLKNLPCDLGLLKNKLEALYPWKVIRTFAPCMRKKDWPEAMTMYLLLTVYLLYGGLQPADLPDLVASCICENQNLELVYEDIVATICEYFCFLALFMDIWEAQFMMLELEQHETATVLQADLWYYGNLRRTLNSKLRRWLDIRFAPAKPVAPTAGTSKLQISTPKGRTGSLVPRKRPLSNSFESSSDTIVPSAPTARSEYERSISWGLDKEFHGTLSLGSGHIQSPPKQAADLLTEEQQRIVDTNLAPGELMKIRAFAGTGKTRSLVEYAKRRPSESFLYIAFGAGAKVDAEKKFGRNVTCKTMHSTALRELESISPIVNAAKNANTILIPVHWGAKDLVALFELDKHSTIIEALENPSNHMPPGERRRKVQLDSSATTQKLPFPTAITVATTIKITLERFWASTYTKVTKYCLPNTMIEKVGLKPASVLHWAKLVWYNIEHGTAPWLPHDAYMKLMQLYPTGDDNAFRQYNTIMFDEAQDATSCMASIILRQIQFGRSVIVAGDPYQKIYGFRLASNDCFNDELYPPTHTCFLTHSFRFGDNIAHIANTLLRALKESQRVHGVRRHDSVKLAPTTVVPSHLRDSAVQPQSEPFTFIFRKNTTLISTAISFCLWHSTHKIRLHLNRSFTRQSLFNNLRSAHALVNGTKVTSGPLAEWKSWDQLKDHVAAASEAGDETSPLLLLLVGLESQLQLDGFLDHLSLLEKNVLHDDDLASPDVIFITAHQAKGLEWDRVHVAAWDFNPIFKKRSALCKNNFMRDECGLLYVAVTRARKELLVAEPVISYLAAEEGVVNVRLSPQMETAKCDGCENDGKDGWMLLEMTRRGLEPGRFVDSPSTEANMRNGSYTANQDLPSSSSSSSTYSDPFTPLSASANTLPSPFLPYDEFLGAIDKPQTITACQNCSHITDHFVSSMRQNNINAPPVQRTAFMKSRWRKMACWDQVWAERYSAETLRVKQGLRRRLEVEESGEEGEGEGDQVSTNGEWGGIVDGWWGKKEVEWEW